MLLLGFASLRGQWNKHGGLEPDTLPTSLQPPWMVVPASWLPDSLASWAPPFPHSLPHNLCQSFPSRSLGMGAGRVRVDVWPSQ